MCGFRQVGFVIHNFTMAFVYQLYQVNNTRQTLFYVLRKELAHLQARMQRKKFRNSQCCKPKICKFLLMSNGLNNKQRNYSKNHSLFQGINQINDTAMILFVKISLQFNMDPKASFQLDIQTQEEGIKRVLTNRFCF